MSLTTALEPDIVNLSDYRILIIEDDLQLCTLIKLMLIKEGFSVAVCNTGEDGLLYAKEYLPNLILLDILLPGIDGYEVCKRLRNDPATAYLNVVMLSSKNSLDDIVTGYELLADDYIPKPFDSKILLLKVRSYFRRADSITNKTDKLYFDGIEINPSSCTISANGKTTSVEKAAMEILVSMVNDREKVFTRNEIKDRFGMLSDYAVTNQIYKLRKTLEKVGVDCIVTVFKGYRLKKALLK